MTLVFDFDRIHLQLILCLKTTITFFNSLFLASFPVRKVEKKNTFVIFLTFDSNRQLTLQLLTSKSVSGEPDDGSDRYLLAWSVGFINFPLLVEEVERRPILPVRILHPAKYQNPNNDD